MIKQVFAKSKRKFINWLATELNIESNSKHLDALQSEFIDHKRGAFHEIKASIEKTQEDFVNLRTEVTLFSKAKDDASKLTLARSMANFAPSAVMSEEGDVENTLGDKDCISVGNNSYVRGRLLTYGHGGRIAIGEWCYVGVRTEIWSMESISIGDRVLISHDVNIHDGTSHSANPAERHEHFKTILLKGHPRDVGDLPGVKSAPIVIEDDVWISFGVTILRGVRIGAGSVIAAKSIVTKDVPPGVLYQGEINPVIKPLPAGGRNEKLLEIQSFSTDDLVKKNPNTAVNKQLS